MKYLLMIYANEATWAEVDEAVWLDRYETVIAELKESGIFLDGKRLKNVDSATSVQLRDGQKLVSDGPFAETKEQLGGFFLVDCQNLDHAIEVAGQIPSAAIGTIEIRPLWYQ